MHRVGVRAALAVLLLVQVWPGSGRADSGGPSAEEVEAGVDREIAPIELPSAQEVEDAVPEGATLTGREIYDRFLKNKLHSGIQHNRVISIDPGGNTQESRFWVRWKDYRDAEDKPTDGVYSKTLIKFLDPFDMRNTAFLMVVREGKAGEKKVVADQFVYQPSARRTRRVKLNGQSVGGTDVSFDDIAFEDADDAEHKRMPDEVINGTPVYVVESTIKPLKFSKYSKTLTYLEKEHYVPLHTRYWDPAKVEVKEMVADPRSIREFNGTWVASEALVTNLKEKTSTKVFVENLDPNPELADRLFSLLRLEMGR
jgi:hypothetical protein